jgi:pimeloyl-ACP methyl ester carboxylesterase
MFKYSDRHRKDAIVLVSGWAFDERIFAQLDLPFNVISYGKMYMGDFEIDLLDYLSRKKLSRVSLLGWSQGALACADFAAGHPEYIRELTLVSLRPSYDQASIDQIKLLLQRNKRAYLRQFYKTCFSSVDLETYRWFKQTLQNEYLDMFLEGELSRGLDWLSQARLCPDALETIPSLTVVHGNDDRIAPVQGVIDLVAKLPQAKLILFKKGGHIPFLSNEFIQHWHGQ